MNKPNALEKVPETTLRLPDRLPEDFSVSRYNSEANLGYTVDNIFRLIKSSLR